MTSKQYSEPIRRLGGLTPASGKPATAAPAKALPRKPAPRLKTGTQVLHSDLKALHPPHPEQFGRDYTGYLAAHASWMRYRTDLFAALAAKPSARKKPRLRKDILKKGDVADIQFVTGDSARVRVPRAVKFKDLQSKYPDRITVVKPVPDPETKKARAVAKRRRYRENRAKRRELRSLQPVKVVASTPATESYLPYGTRGRVDTPAEGHPRPPFGPMRHRADQTVVYVRVKNPRVRNPPSQSHKGPESLSPNPAVPQEQWDKLLKATGRAAQRARRNVRRNAQLP